MKFIITFDRQVYQPNEIQDMKWRFKCNFDKIDNNHYALILPLIKENWDLSKLYSFVLTRYTDFSIMRKNNIFYVIIHNKE